jgi:hypothetical protein
VALQGLVPAQQQLLALPVHCLVQQVLAAQEEARLAPAGAPPPCHLRWRLLLVLVAPAALAAVAVAAAPSRCSWRPAL